MLHKVKEKTPHKVEYYLWIEYDVNVLIPWELQTPSSKYNFEA